MAEMMDPYFETKAQDGAAIRAMQLVQMQEIQLDGSSGGFLGQWYYDITEKKLYVNPMLMLTVGYELGEIPVSYELSQFEAMLDSENKKLFHEQLIGHAEGSTTVIEFVFRMKGKLEMERHIFLSGRRAKGQWQLSFITGEAYDVTAQYVNRRTMKRMVQPDYLKEIQDPLTGLLNKEVFYEKMQHIMTLARAGQIEFCLLTADLDFFHNINSHFGRDKGDLVLEEVGRILRRETRDTDVVGRVGGDKFSILLDSVDGKTGQIIAERIRKSIANHMFVSGIRVTVSGGLVVYNKEGFDELNEIAYKRMRRSKDAGHNRMSYR